MSSVTDWLLEGPAWVAYRTRVDLLGEPETDEKVKMAHQAMVADPAMRQLIDEVRDWPGPAIKTHKTTLPYHKLGFLADVGFRHEDPDLQPIIRKILQNQSPQGPFNVTINLPQAFGGDGDDHQTWILTDAPMVVSVLIKMGLGENEQLNKAVNYLAGLVRENGWPCAAAPELGKFRGPGRKEDPCPFANLVMLKVLADLPGWRDSKEAARGIEMILNQWANRRVCRPYLFRMGTDFCKLKAPFIWFDLLHVLDVLSRFPRIRSDSRYQEMLDILTSKADVNGRFTAESVYLAWNGWEFGQKKAPSRWVTFLASRIISRGSPAV
jgi:hypothetical protein